MPRTNKPSGVLGFQITVTRDEKPIAEIAIKRLDLDHVKGRGKFAKQLREIADAVENGGFPPAARAPSARRS